MSTTSNAQDLLVNVFRPTYRWDSNTGFVPSMVVSNVSELITGRINTDRLDVADSNGNSYIGCNAGPALANLTTYSNTAIGVAAMAGASNSSNNVSIGASNFSGLSNGMCNVGIGANTLITGAGRENILIGTNITMGDGSGNIIIGNDLSLGNISKTFRLGSLLYGDLSSGFVGINTSRPEAALDISGIVVFRNKVGFQNPEPTYSLDVAGSVFASEQIIGSNGTFTDPLFTFKDASGTGMYVPASGAGFGTGAFGITVNRSPAAVFSSNAVNFYQNLDVSGTFSARSVVLDGFEVQDGTAADPTMTFENDTASGLYLVGTSRVGVTTAGLRRMEILPTGDVSLARLVTRDISYSGTIVGTNPNTCNVIGGVTLCNGNVILTGTATNSNLLVPGWIRNTDPATQLDISGGNISNSLTTRSSNFRASAGTAGVPAYSFASDPSTGLHWTGTSQLAFDTSGIQRMCISGGFVGIGTPTPRVALDVSGDISANVYNGPGGTQTAPHYTFSDDRTTGVFFPGANIIGLTAGGTERVRISNSNVGIGTTAPTNALDVSGTLRVIGTAGDLTFSNGSIRLGGATLISSTGVLSNANATSNIIGGVTLNTTDISMTTGGRILGVAATSNTIGGITLSNSNLIAGGFLRNALVPTQFDISGGNISNSATHISSNFIGTAGASNSIGGVVLNNSDLSMNSAGRILAPILRNALVPSTYDISGGNISNSGVHTTAGLVGTYLRNALAPSTYDISGGNISNSLTTTSSNFIGTAAASNSIGGVVLSNSDLSMNSAGRILAPILRNALVPSTYDISGGNISNSGTTRSSNFLAAPGGAPRPAYAFTTDPSSGLDLVGTSYLAFDTSGVQRMCISGTLVGIGTSAPAALLDVSGTIRTGCVNGNELTDITAYNEIGGGVNGDGVGGLPAIAFQGRDGASGRGYRHFIQTVHSGGVSTTANAIRFYICSGGTANASTAPGTGNKPIMAVTQLGVGIGHLDPTLGTLDISSPGTYGIRIRNPAAAGNIGLRISNGFGGTGDLGVAGGNGSWTGGAFAGDTVIRANCNFHVDAKGATRMSVTNVGVGIGTNAPGVLLDISVSDAIGLRVGNGNTVNGSFFQVGTAYTGYANVDMVGYFTVYRAGTTNRAASNVYAQLGCEPGGPHYFMCNNVGIGTTTPGTTLDVSGNAQVALGGAGYAQLTVGSATSGVYIQGNRSNATSYIRSPGAGLYLGGGNSGDATLYILNQRVAINQTDTTYALGVTAGATTAAAINASTWSRSAISTNHYAVWGGQASGGGITWTTCNAMSSDIMTIGDDNGTYFVPKVSGIYSFSIWLGGTTAGDPATYLDVSTNISHNVLNPGLCPQLAMNQTVSGSGRASLFFTGFLPSNSTHYYKTKMVSLGSIATGPSGGKLYVCFLGEVGVGSSRPW